MIHIRIDDEPTNDKRRFACGLGPELPEGHTYFFCTESVAKFKVTCPQCSKFFCHEVSLGTPISQLSTRPGDSGYSEWLRISKSWGYD